VFEILPQGLERHPQNRGIKNPNQQSAPEKAKAAINCGFFSFQASVQ